jgi:hypothetical protein
MGRVPPFRSDRTLTLDLYTEAEMRALTAELSAPGATEPFGAYLFRHNELGAGVARTLETMVFWKSFGDPPPVMEEEYRDYEASSFYFCIFDHLRHVPAGVMRVIAPSPQGFKSLNDIERLWGEPPETAIARTGMGLDMDRTWDVATMAIAEGYRGKAAKGLISMGLYQCLTLAALRCGVEWFVAIFDLPVFRLVRWKLRLIFTGYEGLAPVKYLGSAASIAAWCDVLEAERRLAEDPSLHELLVLGTGLEPALRRLDLSSLGDLDLQTAEAAG